MSQERRGPAATSAVVLANCTNGCQYLRLARTYPDHLMSGNTLPTHTAGALSVWQQGTGSYQIDFPQGLIQPRKINQQQSSEPRNTNFLTVVGVLVIEGTEAGALEDAAAGTPAGGS
jgi:hypothetical protein